MELISSILKKHGTDKVTAHHYGEAYDEVLSKFNREDKLNILEIGTQKGGSLKAWKEAFPNSKVTGLDIVDVVEEKDKDIDYVICDVKYYQTDELFDIVIDDGSHFLRDVVPAVAYFTQRLKPGGIMIIEDVQYAEAWLPVIHNILSPVHDYNKGLKFQTQCFDARSSGLTDDFLINIYKV